MGVEFILETDELAADLLSSAHGSGHSVRREKILLLSFYLVLLEQRLLSSEISFVSRDLDLPREVNLFVLMVDDLVI